MLDLINDSIVNFYQSFSLDLEFHLYLCWICFAIFTYLVEKEYINSDSAASFLLSIHVVYNLFISFGLTPSDYFWATCILIFLFPYVSVYLLCYLLYQLSKMIEYLK